MPAIRHQSSKWMHIFIRAAGRALFLWKMCFGYCHRWSNRTAEWWLQRVHAVELRRVRRAGQSHVSLQSCGCFKYHSDDFGNWCLLRTMRREGNEDGHHGLGDLFGHYFADCRNIDHHFWNRAGLIWDQFFRCQFQHNQCGKQQYSEFSPDFGWRLAIK